MEYKSLIIWDVKQDKIQKTGILTTSGLYDLVTDKKQSAHLHEAVKEKNDFTMLLSTKHRFIPADKIIRVRHQHHGTFLDVTYRNEKDKQKVLEYNFNHPVTAKRVANCFGLLMRETQPTRTEPATVKDVALDPFLWGLVTLATFGCALMLALDAEEMNAPLKNGRPKSEIFVRLVRMLGVEGCLICLGLTVAAFGSYIIYKLIRRPQMDIYEPSNDVRFHHISIDLNSRL
ncbi:MAG: hypothetical protein R3C11_28615 [Planctomycetaceae bacterium]